MRLPLFQVDAFTSQVFGGNPAAVVLLENPLPERTMQAIAMENNLSETAFALPLAGLSDLSHEGGIDLFGLRWFTPKVEVDLCGHATLATGFVLFNEGYVAGKEVHFDTQSGRLTVRREGDLLSMDFPSRPPEPVTVSRDFTESLGADPAEVLKARDHLAVFSTEEEVAALKPDFAKMKTLDAYAIIATAPGKECDFVSRFFGPKAGLPEDPVTGSAHCSLIPYWAAKLGKTRLHARQISQRGGELICELRGDRVAIAGRAVLYLRGDIVF